MTRTQALVFGATAAAVLAAGPLRAQQVSAVSQAPAPRDLPLVEMPRAGGQPGDVLVVMISGDGGWASIDKGVAGRLYEGGLPIVGVNALKYFWNRRTPDDTGRDLTRILRYYLPAWHRRDVVLVGYSRGADVLPFMISRLPEDLRARIRLVALLGPAETVDLKFHVADWWSNSKRSTDLPVLPELQKLIPGTRLLCMYGSDETDSACPRLPPGAAEIVALKGAHHFDGGYEALGDIVLRAIDASPARS